MSSPTPILPEQWNLYIVDLEPRVGTKPGKQRPCLVVQPSFFAQAGLNSSVILPITSKTIEEEAFPLRVRIPNGVCKLEKQSDILVDQILAWDNSLFRKDLGKIPEALQDRVKEALKDFLDL